MSAGTWIREYYPNLADSDEATAMLEVEAPVKDVPFQKRKKR